ncbi:hypothetical protein P608_09945 [Comamonas thiooxydans]|uniref:Uncharacterized protein n=1 Tax=Comamonas thiooxydans TaxID=363952 RepID=A0A0E3BVL3_9BURK|nr:hypothetical protein P608_09945 [Comamonas thiooxydans]KGH24054.1 hypothetical protein P606_10160 [Comamonas thiooxydans]KGH25682.1 hypothetical protein P607_05535 [Comamonas thiooxydans]
MHLFGKRATYAVPFTGETTCAGAFKLAGLVFTVVTFALAITFPVLVVRVLVTVCGSADSACLIGSAVLTL